MYSAWPRQPMGLIARRRRRGESSYVSWRRSHEIFLVPHRADRRHRSSIDSERQPATSSDVTLVDVLTIFVLKGPRRQLRRILQ